ncbi:MAG: hypothetical protein AAGG44_10835 [Planctomycetota bacterium]
MPTSRIQNLLCPTHERVVPKEATWRSSLQNAVRFYRCFLVLVCFGSLASLASGACIVNGSTLQQAEQENEATVSDEVKTDAEQDASTDADSEEETASDVDASEEGVRARLVIDGLNNPSGIAIQPETGVVFVADSGNQRIIKLVDGKSVEAITEFPGDVYGKGPKLNIGPLGLFFLSKTKLIVGGGGLPDGEELLRIYDLPEDGKAIKAEQMTSSFSLSASDEVVGEGNFYAVTATPNGIYVTCNGDDEKGWVSKATMDEEAVVGYSRFLATKEATGVNAPVGITISPDGYLVVGQMGAINVAGDSLLTFYDENTKEMLLNLKTGLNDISAVAYSRRRQMYVLDYSWADPNQGGLFRIVEDLENASGMKAEKLVSLDKPTAMAFDSNGDLYITIVGEQSDENEGNSVGQLLVITKETGL